jgi:hypothetical protein
LFQRKKFNQEEFKVMPKGKVLTKIYKFSQKELELVLKKQVQPS